MRRFAFYFLVSLLTFSSGIFIVYQLPGPAPAEIGVTASVEFPEAIPAAYYPPQNDNEDYSEKEVERDQMKCYQPLIGRWLAGRPIKEEVRELKQNDEFCASNGFEALPYLRDFNGDGQKELAIRTGCAAVGNCQFFVFRKTGKSSYKTILKADMVQQFRLLKSKVKGYYDLETRTHADALSGEIVIYRYGSGKYKSLNCARYDYPMHPENAKPVITPRKCPEFGYLDE
ncbi:MAG TPA: hypothetical protein VGO50_13635 [Pyrinomonadaceae bacterium]|jgi:hypothetical protein|nr:hypothetical protein [Pyrinomonadaceae bacterium]